MAGGLKAAKTIRKRYGEDYYNMIGRKGGQTSKKGGFAANPELARIAGRKGAEASAKVRARKPEVEVISFTPYCDGDHTALKLALKEQYAAANVLVVIILAVTITALAALIVCYNLYLA